MLSHKIIKYKQVVQQFPVASRSVVHQKAPNKSFIITQEILDTFLARQPKAGDYLYRSLANDGCTQNTIDHPSGITKVISVVDKLVDLSFDWQTGFPLTHRVVTLFSGNLNPWIRLEDITRYSLLSQEHKDKWLHDQLQNTFKEVILKAAD